MITVERRIWEAWRELEARFEEPAIALLFSSRVDSEETLGSVRTAASETIEELRASAGRPGHWLAAAVPEGVALRIDEAPADFARLLEGIAARLEAQGVEGSFTLYEPEPVDELPERIHLFECRLRVNGERRHLRGPNWGWLADPGALRSVVEAAVEWCVRNDRRLPLTAKIRTMPAVLLSHDQDIRTYVRQGLDVSAEVGVVRLTSAAPDRFRTVVVQPSRGRVSLIEGGATIETGGWQTARSSLRATMVATSAQTVYGFLKRGSHLPAAESGYSLSQDWLPAEHHEPATQLGEPFEAEYAPDAFGLQLLGPAYAGRVPEGAAWSRTAAGAGAIFEHRDPEAWFAELLVPFGGRPNYTLPPVPEVPDVLARAREDFADILFRDELAWGPD